MINAHMGRWYFDNIVGYGCHSALKKHHRVVFVMKSVSLLGRYDLLVVPGHTPLPDLVADIFETLCRRMVWNDPFRPKFERLRLREQTDADIKIGKVCYKKC